MDQLLSLEELNELTEEERKVALEILRQYSNEGSSDLYTELLYADYKEIPVDIITFIKDDRYLGRAWHLGTKLKLFPYWEKKLKEIFPTNIDTSINNLILSGARGLGKSEIAITCILYLMYRVMCLKNPHEFLNLKPTEKVAFALMNITKDLAEDIAVSKFQHTVQVSPWFLERGTLTGRDEVIWNPPEYIDVIIGSQPRHVIGQAIYAAFFDEISFIPNQDIDKQKAKALDMIDTAMGGMKTRFLNNGKNPTLMILASSKRSEKSFLETHMKKKAETEGENTIIVDEPVWNIRPAEEYSGKRFYVAVGNKFLASEVILEENPDLKRYKEKGFKTLSVPIEFKANFLENIDRALCDYAGISSSDITKYISAARLQDVKSDQFLNLFTRDVIEVGNAPDDKTQYYDFIDLSRLDRRLLDRPLFIHLDMSLSGDKTGIVGIWVMGKKPGLNNDARELYYRVAFNVSIKAPRGYQVSFAKNREFIYWLKAQGFAIKGITTDTYQNAALGQDLISKGYPYSVLSVDRVNKDRICEPYAYLKNTIYEKRIQLYDSELLTEELLGLERNNNTGKIDHPDGGKSGSKDAADALAGSIFNASLHAEEFAFEYGEDLDRMVEVSMQSSNEENRKTQITLDFEAELQRAFEGAKLRDYREKIIEDDNSVFMDFGMGKAKALNPFYLSQGIIL